MLGILRGSFRDAGGFRFNLLVFVLKLPRADPALWLQRPSGLRQPEQHGQHSGCAPSTPDESTTYTDHLGLWQNTTAIFKIPYETT